MYRGSPAVDVREKLRDDAVKFCQRTFARDLGIVSKRLKIYLGELEAPPVERRARLENRRQFEESSFEGFVEQQIKQRRPNPIGYSENHARILTTLGYGNRTAAIYEFIDE